MMVYTFAAVNFILHIYLTAGVNVQIQINKKIYDKLLRSNFLIPRGEFINYSAAYKIIKISIVMYT